MNGKYFIYKKLVLCLNFELRYPKRVQAKLAKELLYSHIALIRIGAVVRIFPVKDQIIISKLLIQEQITSCDIVSWFSQNNHPLSCCSPSQYLRQLLHILFQAARTLETMLRDEQQ